MKEWKAVTELEKERLKDLHDRGINIDTIAKMTGRSPSSIRYHIDKKYRNHMKKLSRIRSRQNSRQKKLKHEWVPESKKEDMEEKKEDMEDIIKEESFDKLITAFNEMGIEDLIYLTGILDSIVFIKKNAQS